MSEVKTGPVTRLLIAARMRILGPGKWTKGAYARDGAGDSCNVLDPKARCWCMVGALEAEAKRSTPSWEPLPDGAEANRSNPSYHKAHRLLGEAVARMHGVSTSLTVHNDGGNQESVLKAYMMAIKDAKGS